MSHFKVIQQQRSKDLSDFQETLQERIKMLPCVSRCFVEEGKKQPAIELKFEAFAQQTTG